MKIKNVLSNLPKGLLCATIPFSLAYPEEAKGQERPNVIFIFADDLGWGDLSCYGNDRRDVKTPYLDKLAEEGTLFTHFYAPGSVCSPSRVGVMTGQYPARNGVFAHISNEEANERRGIPNTLDPNLFTIIDLFNQKGYTTAHFGKYHLGNGTHPGDFRTDVYRTREGSNVKGGKLLDLTSHNALPHTTGAILDESMDFIREYGENPFYINVWLKDVHAILNPTDEQLGYVTQFEPRGNIRFYGAEQVYYASLKEMDRQIGRFMTELDAMKLRENTIVIFASDNGPEDYQIANSAHSGVGNAGPFRGRKRSVYEGGIRVPFIISWPGQIPVGRINDISAVNGVDFIPTFASMLGAELPADIDFDGEDMSDVWLGSDRKREKTMYWEWRYDIYSHIVHKSPVIAIREGDYKLLINPDGTRLELYNLINDPSELQNLARLKPDMANELAEKALELYNAMPYGPPHRRAGTNTWEGWPGN